MSTRGIIGVRIRGEDKIAYNDNSSYPAWLGRRLVDELHDLLKFRWQLEAAACALQAVTPGSSPTPQQLDRLAQFRDGGVGGDGPDEGWYRLLRRTQGSLKAMLAAGLYQDQRDFTRDGAFCEWGYVANLDRNMLEVYRGDQTRKHRAGRFAAQPRLERKNYPIALVAEVPFAVIQAEPETAYRYLESMSSGPPKREATYVGRLQGGEDRNGCRGR